MQKQKLHPTTYIRGERETWLHSSHFVLSGCSNEGVLGVGGGGTEAYMVLVEHSLGRRRRGCENNIRMNLKEICYNKNYQQM